MEQDLTLPECEFFCENKKQTIVPNFKHEELSLLSGTFGPFRPGLPLEVPLWLAISLKKQQKCQIVVPAWMDHEVLQAKLEEEKVNESLTQIDFYYFEMASLLLTHAKEDFKHKKLIRRLLEDLYNVRSAKINKSLKNLSEESSGVELANIASIELQNLRRVMIDTFTNIQKIKASK